jgi:hypothetical protein
MDVDEKLFIRDDSPVVTRKRCRSPQESETEHEPRKKNNGKPMAILPKPKPSSSMKKGLDFK